MVNITETSCTERLGGDRCLLLKMIHFISTHERDFHLRTESGRENLVLEGPTTLHCENRRYYGLGMAMCKASLPADLTNTLSK